MPGHKCETCELTFNNFQEKLKHFTENHKNRYIKYCSRCHEAIYFLPQFTKHKKHNKFLESEPLYCSRSLVSGQILDQICPFCRQNFFYKKELEKHLKNFCRCKVQRISDRRTGKFPQSKFSSHQLYKNIIINIYLCIFKFSVL